MSHFKGFRRHDWLPTACAIGGLVLAACACAVVLLYFTGMDFR